MITSEVKIVTKRTLIFLTVVLALILTGCGQTENTPDDAGYSDAETSIVSGSDEALESNDLVSGSEKGSSDFDEQGDYDSLTELFKIADNNWNDSEEYLNAINAYEAVLDEAYKLVTERGYGKPRFTVAYIDDDAVPELLVSYGNQHTCGVCVYRYFNSEVNYIGEFGSFGIITYYPGGLIESYYGNHGCYTSYLSQIDGDCIKLVDSWLVDGSGIIHPETYYYHGYSTYDSIDGSRDSFERSGMSELFVNIPELDDSDPNAEENYLERFRISEEDYLKEKPMWIGHTENEGVHVSYDQMYKITRD